MISKYSYYQCICCGQAVDLNVTPWNTDIIQERICIDCHRWHELAKRQDELWVINGQLFELHPRVDQTPKDNGLQKLWYILTPESLFIADSLFNYGTIPKHVAHLFHNHARFMRKGSFLTIYRRRKFRCHKKGCWGRRNCWWYEGDMDFNKIPPLKNPNPEDCPIFLQNFKTK